MPRRSRRSTHARAARIRRRSSSCSSRASCLAIAASRASGSCSAPRAAARSPAGLACSFELGVADEHLALFLVTAGDGVTGATGFADAPSGTIGGPLELAAGLAAGGGVSLLSRDERGYWASVEVKR